MKIKALLITLALAHICFTLFINPPGYLTYDSGTYHFMLESFSQNLAFGVDNGYGALPSPELMSAQLREHDGRLFAQYPEYITFLGMPFYLLLGYPGLLLLNALAFLGINFLLFRLGKDLFDNPAISWLSMFVYSGATYAWEYSQSSYPHLSSTFFLVLGSWLMTRVLRDRTARPLLSAIGSGFCVSFAIGLRLDSLFALPGVLLPYLWVRPLNYKMLLATLTGMVPNLLILSWINLIKFDKFFPFYYGAPDAKLLNPMPYVGPALAALALVLLGIGLLHASRPWRKKILWTVLIVSVMVGLIGHQKIIPLVLKTAGGIYQINVDMRIREQISESALSRTPSGAMVYMQSVKKSLLQSCPYLILLLFLFRRPFRNNLQALTILLTPSVGVIAIFSYLAWHGSVALNMRYLNGSLPYLAMSVAWILSQEKLITLRNLLFGWALATAFFFFIFTFMPHHLTLHEIFTLNLPLALAFLLLLFTLVHILAKGLPLIAQLHCFLIILCLAYSGAVGFAHDYPTSRDQRNTFLNAGKQIQPYVANRALIFSELPDTLWLLIDQVEGIVIATPTRDDYSDYNRLVDYHLSKGRPVYHYVPSQLVNDFKERTHAYEVKEITRESGPDQMSLYQITHRND